MQTPTAIKQVTKHSEVLQTADLIVVYLKKKKANPVETLGDSN